ncbi:MAG: amylo-alpha-1,6-glucosidase [Planctomycetaceae bacterium]
MSNDQFDTREWLEADGLGGFASGTVSGLRTRRYHALLLVATRPPAGRVVLVNGFDAWVETPVGTFPLSTQRYPDGVVWPNGHRLLRDFTADPWPVWEFAVTGVVTVRQELFVPHDVTGVAFRWSVRGPRSGVRLHVRPFLSGRDYHSLHHENPDFHFGSRQENARIEWQPYGDLPQVLAESNGAYEQQPAWYRGFVYEQERERGLDFTEDLASPGEFHWNLATDDAVLLLSAGKSFSEQTAQPDAEPLQVFLHAEAGERKRRTAISSLERAADAFIARRGDGNTIIAGFPWFTDWGRDTFIALRGLCLRPSRLAIARQILLAWSQTVSAGMLPNRFPDHGDEPEYNSADASLWYVIAAHDYLEAMQRAGQGVPVSDRTALTTAVDAILTGYSRGTRFGIRADDDGLLAAGQAGVQLTWMDAKVGDWVVTPRMGKPVEIQALWLNALWIGGQTAPLWLSMFEKGQPRFIERFWNESGNCLYDVVDADHRPGAVDDSFRPNQILAVGGLPLQILDGERSRRMVDAVERQLLTPLGLRSLAPDDPDYRPRYEGGVWERDGAYHQGTVWPWLIGPFVEAWVRVRGNSDEAKREARRRFVEPLLHHLDEAGLGHISEIADAEPPHTPRGCPFQAWSLGELLRLQNEVLHIEPSPQHKLERQSQTDGCTPPMPQERDKNRVPIR